MACVTLKWASVNLSSSMAGLGWSAASRRPRAHSAVPMLRVPTAAALTRRGGAPAALACCGEAAERGADELLPVGNGAEADCCSWGCMSASRGMAEGVVIA